MLDGDVLSLWLQHRAGTVLRGSLIRLSPAGLLRVSMADDSRPVQVQLPVQHGGQAAVARASFCDAPDATALALRVQAVSSEEEKLRQMERLLSMLSVVTAAREQPATYPAVLPVAESFVVTVPGTQMPTSPKLDEYELWCDVMAWCETNLAERHQADGLAARGLQVVVPRLLPVFATVNAVHENLGVIHRDITPNNVLVDRAGRLQLADWGIAHVLAPDKTSTFTQRVGNVGYAIPPETLRGDKAIGRYTDAWYLGCLFVWMLTGQLPGPEGALPAGLPVGPVGDRVDTIARGLCQPDPRRRMGLPEAGARLAELVGGPPVLSAPARPEPVVVGPGGGRVVVSGQPSGPVASRPQPSGPVGPRGQPSGPVASRAQPLGPAALLVAPDQPPVKTVPGRSASQPRPLSSDLRRIGAVVLAVVFAVVVVVTLVVHILRWGDTPGDDEPGARGPGQQICAVVEV